MKLHTRLLVGLLAGLALGAVLHPSRDTAWVTGLLAITRPIGQVFLRSIFMIVVPMVFSALVIGVYELGKAQGLGNVIRRTIAFTVVLSTSSVVIGMLLVNLLGPGRGLNLQAIQPSTGGVETLETNAAAARPIGDALVELIPRNPLDSAVRALDGEMLPLMIFALIFGVALSQARESARGPREESESASAAARASGGGAPRAGINDGNGNVLIDVLTQVFDACMRIVHFVMKFAPIAVFAIVFGTAVTFGTTVFVALFFYVASVVAGLLIQQFGVYSTLLAFVARRSPLEFFRSCRDVYLYAFSTASSNATLPLALETAETKLKLPPRISRFVLTVGATANQNGTALFEGVTVLFLAQVYGLDLGLGQQVRVMLMSILAGIGTAGVPGGSLPLVLIVAQSVGVPAEGMALILGVDRFLDMSRTTLNVSGDLVIAALVSGPRKLGIGD
jgi:DAACS family dicarboxylate/amino acid:cation (Na+ or H+) symporter